jgi:cytochrome c oxidase assembly factor CtaG
MECVEHRFFLTADVGSELFYLHLWCVEGLETCGRRTRRIGSARSCAYWCNVSTRCGAVSPLDVLSSVLFSAHMVQHMLLILVAVPLLAYRSFPLVTLWALPRRWSHSIAQAWKRTLWLRQVWHLLSRPSSAWLLFAVSLWIWHAPLLYQAALNNQMIHSLEHIGFLLTAILFWWVLINPSRPIYWRYGLISSLQLCTPAF